METRVCFRLETKIPVPSASTIFFTDTLSSHLSNETTQIYVLF